ncbi:MAG: glycosyltransferase [Actinomycetales bacterium]|nr:glycosyltransferase [Actinomycetales bacterium]
MPHSVSIQICALNEEANIAECLSAVVANQPEEIVIIDGGSSDRTVEIAREFGARVIEAGRLGLGPSRQLGYRSTSCRYSAFVDADDRLAPDWTDIMIEELEAGGYAALQSSLRAVQTGSWWSRGWNQYFIESVRPTADTTMVGRPALFLTSALLQNDEDLISLDEDTHLSRRFELQGLRQGIGTAIAYRHVEDSWPLNRRKWQSYGRGYRGFVNEHPSRRNALIRHMALTIPISRSWRPVKRGHIDQPAFGLLMAASIGIGWLQGPGSLETPKAANRDS